MAFPSELFKNEVLYKVEDGVCVITLNAPDRMNTMGAALNTGVQVALDMATEDPEVRVIVFTGTGRAFCAGGNLSPEAEDGAATGFKGKEGQIIPATVNAAVRNLRHGMSSSEVLRETPKPTIAAVYLTAACLCCVFFRHHICPMYRV
jgi:enoyl-CoA hydratase/carnithine racemase